MKGEEKRDRDELTRLYLELHKRAVRIAELERALAQKTRVIQTMREVNKLLLKDAGIARFLDSERRRLEEER